MNLEESVEIEASRDRVWEVISDFQREKEYWHSIKDVKVISKTENVVEREVVQNFRNGKVLQRVVLHPKNSIEYFHLKGSMRGTKVLFIEPAKEKLIRLTAAWHIRLNWTLIFLNPVVKRHIREGTVNALKRIKAVCEGREEELSEAE